MMRERNGNAREWGGKEMGMLGNDEGEILIFTNLMLIFYLKFLMFVYVVIHKKNSIYFGIYIVIEVEIFRCIWNFMYICEYKH